MHFPRSIPSPLTSVAILVVSAVALSLMDRRGEGPPGPDGPAAETLAGADDSVQLPGEIRDQRRRGNAGQAAPSEGPLLDAREACSDAGYLCSDLEDNGTLRMFRWPSATPFLQITVPLPQHLTSSRARRIQRAAVRGIRAWHGHPFPLSIRTRSSSEDTDVSISWKRTLEGGKLGRVETEWTREGTDVRMRILALTLATHLPSPEGDRGLTEKQVELVSAHEMGHALGLPHSDDRRDVMYPENTAQRLTARDFRTLQALYRLPNGAEIRRRR